MVLLIYIFRSIISQYHLHIELFPPNKCDFYCCDFYCRVASCFTDALPMGKAFDAFRKQTNIRKRHTKEKHL